MTSTQKSYRIGLKSSLLEKIGHIIGGENIVSNEQSLDKLSENTLDSKRVITACVFPGSQEETLELIKLFDLEGVAFYPVSTGRNWGYGGITPVQDGCVILNLSRLQRIVEFNPDLGYVVVEPGVTQQHLFDYLKKNSPIEFLVPTTGAGPNASILGNALERGYGITPIEDHYGALLKVKAALSDGRIYKSALSDAGGNFSDLVFKWKIGPYLDGLFAQSNVGVVLEGGIALPRKPENITQFIAFLRDEDFESAVLAVRNIKQTLGGIVGGVNLMNKRRLLAMLESEWTQGQAMEEIRVIALANKRELSDWVMVGALYGTHPVVKSSLKYIRNQCKSFSKKFDWIDRKKYVLADRLLKFLPLPKSRLMLSTAGRALEILEGKPSALALPLAYLKNKRNPESQELNPDKDGCGLMWFAPLVPMEPPVVRDFVQEVAKICLFYNIDPLITLTSISERCFDATIPLLFSKTLLGESQRAQKCYSQLIEVCRDMGLFPYRLDIDHMHLLANEGSTAYDMQAKIKSVLDPKNIIAPGRYALGNNQLKRS